MSAESDRPPAGLKRDEVYPEQESGGFLHWLRELLVSKTEREEADLERRIRTAAKVSRANVIAVISPKGGVGKTTSSFLVGNLLATHLRLRAVAIDANPDFGTLAALAPDELRSDKTLADLLEDAEGVGTAAEVRPYVSTLPSGLHILASPLETERMAALTNESYGWALDYMGHFYETVILDMGTGVAGPLARFAIERADQVVLVTTPEWVTSSIVLSALEHLAHDRTTLLVNKSLPSHRADLDRIEERFREQRLHRSVTIPFDERLQVMLDSGTYSLDTLDRDTRLAVKRLGLAVVEQLV
jgi:putative peptide zinc metalloprotease protein